MNPDTVIKTTLTILEEVFNKKSAEDVAKYSKQFFANEQTKAAIREKMEEGDEKDAEYLETLVNKASGESRKEFMELSKEISAKKKAREREEKASEKIAIEAAEKKQRAASHEIL